MDSNPRTPHVAPPPLRRYQLEPIREILASIRAADGRTFVVEIARQGGKNEISSRLEALVLKAHEDTGGSIVKTAPTLRPQLITSYDRLRTYLAADRIKHRAAWPRIWVGQAAIDFRSGEPSADVAGATASLLLEVDEAQDYDPDVYQRRFRPMASTTGATTVIYGTAWSDIDLLATTIAANRQLEQNDGLRRNFIYPADVVGAFLPTYARFVASERARLGASHPLLQTEYDLIPLTGEGKLLNPAQLTRLLGNHPSLPGPILADRYAAGLDVGGEDTGAGNAHDRTVLTIARVKGEGAPGTVPLDVVAHYAWRGARHADVIDAVAHELTRWRVFAISCDATGVGEATAGILAKRLPRITVEPFKYTQASKSALGFDLITATNTGALQLYADDGSAHFATLTRELAAARRDTNPNGTINFYVPEELGNDDYLQSLALVNRAAQQHPPRLARQR